MVAQPTPPPPLGTLIDDGSGALELVSILGCGGYGIVYRARDVNSQFPKYYAVKCLIRPSTSRPSRQRQLHLREITLHQLASPHPNVISIHRVIDPVQSPYTFLVMDYCTDGDLFSMILHKRRYLGNDALIRHVFLQLLDAVEYCHSLSIFHRDLKPENILCFDDGLTLALTDFGLATTDKVSTEFRTGSVYHMSPECQGGPMAPLGTYSPRQNDIWSLGIILLNLCTGRNPWSSATPTDPTFNAYLEAPTNFLPSVLPISPQLNALLVRVFDIQPMRRPTLKEFKDGVRKMHNFYSSDAVFEGSMAKCPWEVGQNIGEDSDEIEEMGYSEAASIPREQSTLPDLPVPTNSLDQRTLPAKSRWSPDSVADSEMVFATPSVGVSSYVSRNGSIASRGTYDVDRRQKRSSRVSHRNPKSRPHLRIDVRGPRERPRQMETPSTAARSPGSPIFNFISPPLSPHTDSGEPPATPGDAFEYPAGDNAHSNGIIAISAESHSRSSYHTSFDDNSLIDSTQPYSAVSDTDIVKILPSPDSEQKRYEFGTYNPSTWYSSSSLSPSRSWRHVVPQSEVSDSDFPMSSPTTAQDTDDSTGNIKSTVEILRSDYDSTSATSPAVTSPADTDDHDTSMDLELSPTEAEFDEEPVLPGSYFQWSPVATAGHFFVQSSLTSSTRRTDGSVATGKDGVNKATNDHEFDLPVKDEDNFESSTHRSTLYNPWTEQANSTDWGWNGNLPDLSSEPSWTPTELVPVAPLPTPVSNSTRGPSIHNNHLSSPQVMEPPEPPNSQALPAPIPIAPDTEKKPRNSSYAIFRFVLSRTFSPQNTQFQSFAFSRPLPSLPDAARSSAIPISVPEHTSSSRHVVNHDNDAATWFPQMARSSTASSRSRSRSRTRKRVTSITSHFRFRQRTLQDLRSRPKSKRRSKSLPNSLSARKMFLIARNWLTGAASSSQRLDKSRASTS